MAFIRILSPSSAPPVLRFEGSTEITPIRLLSKSIKLDFNEPHKIGSAVTIPRVSLNENCPEPELK